MNDLIYRKDAIEDYIAGFGITLDDIEKIPAVDAEPVRHGRWEFVGQMTNAPVYKCTVCKQPSYAKHDWCPRCGAKMDLDEVKE